jgi:hypothetical protein
MLSKTGFGSLVLGAWLGTQACVFAHDEACATDLDCRAGRACSSGKCVDRSGGEPPGEVPDGPSEQCTTQSEIQRWQELKGGPSAGVPIPAECQADTLSGAYNGELATWDRDDTSAGLSMIDARFSGPSLLELEGVACQAIFPGRASNSTFFGSEESKCAQYFACGCCIVEVQREPLVRGDEPVRNDVWTVEKTAGCKLPLKNSHYYFNVDFDEPNPNPPNNPGGGGDACSTCLSGCQGLPSCCTGSGCQCQSACAPSSDCAPGSTYCCGPDGFCFCTPNCPY